MKNNNKIHLSDLTNYLKNTHVKLDLEFLAKLLKNASKCESPAINKEFIAKIVIYDALRQFWDNKNL